MQGYLPCVYHSQRTSWHLVRLPLDSSGSRSCNWFRVRKSLALSDKKASFVCTRSPLVANYTGLLFSVKTTMSSGSSAKQKGRSQRAQTAARSRVTTNDKKKLPDAIAAKVASILLIAKSKCSHEFLPCSPRHRRSRVATNTSTRVTMEETTRDRVTKVNWRRCATRAGKCHHIGSMGALCG